LTPDPIKQKYAQTIVSKRIVPGCVQFLGEEKRFYTAWVINGPDGPEIRLPLFPRKRTQVGHRAMSVSCQQRTHAPQQNRRWSIGEME